MIFPARIDHTNQPESRPCYACGNEFQPRTASRRSRCPTCAAAYMRGYRAAKRDCRMLQFAAEVRQQRTTAGAMAATAHLAQAFGGPLGFAVAFKNCFDACPVGSLRRVRMLDAFLRLMESNEPPPLDQMSDAELDATNATFTSPSALP